MNHHDVSYVVIFRGLTEFAVLLCIASCVTAIGLRCRFKMETSRTSYGYNCRVEKNFVVATKNTTIDGITGKHVGRWSTNADVERIYFSDNLNMKYVPVGYSKFFKAISNFWVENCPIESISSSDFENAEIIKIIGFIDTKINKIDDEVFSRLVNLNSLYLNSNQITKIDENAFAAMSNLKSLNLASNKLGFLPSRLFVNNKNLQEINFNDNKLKIIESGVFAGMNELMKVELKGNFCVRKTFPTDTSSFAEFEQLINKDCSNPLSELLVELKSHKTNSESLIAVLQSRKVENEAKIAKDSDENAKLTIVNKDLRVELEILHANHSEAREKIEEIVNKTMEMEIELEKTNATLEEILEEKILLADEFKDLTERFEKLQGQHTALTDDNVRYRAEIAEIESNLTSLREDKIYLEDAVDQLKLNQSELLFEIEQKDLDMNQKDDQLRSSLMLEEQKSGIFVTPMEIFIAAVILAVLVCCILKVVQMLMKKKRRIYNTGELEDLSMKDEGNSCQS